MHHKLLYIDIKTVALYHRFNDSRPQAQASGFTTTAYGGETMATSSKLKAAIIGSGNIGTDLMIKIMRNSRHLEVAAMVGIDPNSDGLARAARLGVATTHEGVEGLTRLPVFSEIDFVFDATSAGAHPGNDARLRALKPSIRMIDLTPAAIGPYCVPVVNLDAHIDAPNVNMATCGG